MKTEDFVLIVEDDKDWRNIIKSLVKKNFGLNCRAANNYQSSMRLLKSAKPLVLILDLNLGKNKFNESNWGGWRLAEAAKDKRIPIIIVTGYPRDDRIARAFKDYKVVDFFDKRHLADRTPDFINDIDGILSKAKKRKSGISTQIKKNKRNNNSKSNSVFISYSHKDYKWLNKFTPHLKVLEENNQLTVWNDTKIKPGTRWKNEIKIALSNASTAILLVTPDFLASDFINKEELPVLFRAAEKRGLLILWVAVKFSLYKETYIAEFQSANNPDKPLVSLSPAKAEQEIVQICQKVKEATK